MSLGSLGAAFFDVEGPRVKLLQSVFHQAYMLRHLLVPQTAKYTDLAVCIMERLSPRYVLLMIRSFQGMEVTEPLSLRRLKELSILR
jgi:hypothetical protein